MDTQVGAGILATSNMFAVNILVHVISCPCARDYFVYLTSFFWNQQYCELEEHLWEQKSPVLFISVWCEEVAHKLRDETPSHFYIVPPTIFPVPPRCLERLWAASRRFLFTWLWCSQCLLTLSYFKLFGGKTVSLWDQSFLVLPCVYSGQFFALFYLTPATKQAGSILIRHGSCP